MSEESATLEALSQRVDAMEARLEASVASDDRQPLVVRIESAPSPTSYYLCDVVKIEGEVIVGEPAIITPTGKSIAAKNLGGGVPDIGSCVAANPCDGGGWTFRYD